MKKAFRFVESLSKSFLDVMGMPTIKVGTEYTEVVFSSDKVIKTLLPFPLLDYDGVQFYADGNCIKFVFTFYHSEN